MFEIPSNSDIERCVITKETVINGEEPQIYINKNKSSNRTTRKIKTKSNNDMETA